MKIDSKKQFTATGNYGAFSIPLGKAIWTSSNSSVISITPTGLATAKYKSTANIKAGFGGISSPPLSVTVN
jgi:uncharacterized protein YgiB involved in biofilm formation